MDKGLCRDRDPIRPILAAILVLAVVGMAFAITSERGGLRVMGDDQPAAGASGIARPHPPLDRAPGEPLKTPL
jgi:hypothetical protein